MRSRDFRRSSGAGELVGKAGQLALRLRAVDLRQEAELLRLIPTSDELADAAALEIDLANAPAFYPSFVAPVCAWFAANRSIMSHLKVVVVKPNDERAARWLDKVGFFDLLVKGVAGANDDELTMALHLIDPAERESTERAIEHMSNLLRRHAQGFSGDVLHSAQVALAEVVENSSRHARSATPAFVCGQYHPSNRKFSLCVADCGIGIRESFRTAPYRPARERLEAGDNPLELAIEPLMSSKYGMGHSGYGLFYASELCALASGTFVISSNDQTLVIARQGPYFLGHENWPGTIVNLLLDTTVPVRGEQILEKMPSQHEDEDKWLTTFTDHLSPPFVALSTYGTRLYTREAAREILDNVQESLLAGAPISLEHVTTMTPSFADEFFRVLFETVGEEQYRKHVRVARASDYLKRLIEFVLKNRPSARQTLPE